MILSKGDGCVFANIYENSYYVDFFKNILLKDQYMKAAQLSVRPAIISGYDSILVSMRGNAYWENKRDILFARLKNNSGKGYISFKVCNLNWFRSHNIPTEQFKSDAGFFRLALENFYMLEEQPSEEVIELVRDMIISAMEFEPFGCCAKYVECSNSKRCLHSDPLYSKACMYRKNLEAGKIFYGVNENMNVGGMQHNRQYVVFDVETADKANSYICSIGLAVVSNGKIKNTCHTLVKPNCEFGDHNVKIHGITKDMVADSPTFFEIWSNFHVAFENAIMVAHNAHFDLNVINKEIIRNNIRLDSITYIDTLQVARKCLDLEHYGLEDVCKELDVELENHHCALDDCVAAAKVLIKMLDKYEINLDDFIRTFDVGDKSNRHNMAHTNKSSISIGVNLTSKCPKIDFFSECPKNINLENVTVCLSGNFQYMPKTELSIILESKGAIVKKAVTKSLEYLVVGEQGSGHWAYGSFGTKVEKARHFNNDGSSIMIVREKDFFNCANIDSIATGNELGEPNLKTEEDKSYVSPKGEWHKFNSVEEKIAYLKKHRILAPTAMDLKNVYYNGVFTKAYTLCDICGYVDDTIMVIELNNKFHCIDVDCIRDMQPTKNEKEKYGLS